MVLKKYECVSLEKWVDCERGERFGKSIEGQEGEKWACKRGGPRGTRELKAEGERGKVLDRRECKTPTVNQLMPTSPVAMKHSIDRP